MSLTLFNLANKSMFGKKKSDVNLKWEWPDEREPDYLITVQVDSIKKDSPGLFGIKHSPSILGWIPGGVILRGHIADNRMGLSGKTLSLLLPVEETHAAKKGDTLVLGIVDHDTCIVVTKLEYVTS